MKIELGKPVVVAQGPTYEEVSWGPFQFPGLGMTDDGRITCWVEETEDDMTAYGADKTWFVSSDRGETWKPISAREAAKNSFPKLPNGDRLACHLAPPVNLDEGIYANAKPVMTVKGYADIYSFDSLKKGAIPKVLRFDRLPAGKTEMFVDEGKIEYWPHMAITKTTEGTLLPFLFGRLRVAPDGALWHTHYYHGMDPKTGEGVLNNSAYYFRSTDMGKTWRLASWINPYKTEGAGSFCEQDIAWTSDGTAITLLRSEGCSFIATSPDGGFTWNDPVVFDEIGVDPCIKPLGCGVMLASYGRPGFFVRACFDKKGENWEDPIAIIENRDHSGEMNTKCNPGPGHSWGACSYSDILPISDTEALVTYTDFFVPDAQGIKRKSLMVVKVTVKE